MHLLILIINWVIIIIRIIFNKSNQINLTKIILRNNINNYNQSQITSYPNNHLLLKLKLNQKLSHLKNNLINNKNLKRLPQLIRKHLKLIKIHLKSINNQLKIKKYNHHKYHHINLNLSNKIKQCKNIYNYYYQKYKNINKIYNN